MSNIGQGRSRMNVADRSIERADKREVERDLTPASRAGNLASAFELARLGVYDVGAIGELAADCKHPPRQVTDDKAREALESFTRGE